MVIKNKASSILVKLFMPNNVCVLLLLTVQMKTGLFENHTSLHNPYLWTVHILKRTQFPLAQRGEQFEMLKFKLARNNLDALRL